MSIFEPIKNRPKEDCLIIGFDNAQNGDNATLTVMKIKNGTMHVENMFINEDAVEMYDKLIEMKRI